MNKKGDVPVALLAVVAVGLVLYAGFAFIGVFGGFGNSSGEYSALMSRAELNENYVRGIVVSTARDVVSQDKSSQNELADIKTQFKVEFEKRNNTRIDGVENVFGKIRNGEFIFEKREGKYYLEINDTFVQAEVGYNKIKRNFDIIEYVK